MMMNPAIIPNAAQQPSGLLNTAANYSFPLTSGLLSSVGQGSLGSAPPGVPNYSAMALQMAGNPQAGPLAPVPIPSGAGIPGASTGGGGGSSALAGLLTAAAQNPGLVKNAVSGISGLLGGGTTAGAAASDSIPANAALAASTTADGTPYYLAADTGAPAAAPLGGDVLAGAGAGALTGAGIASGIGSGIGAGAASGLGAGVGSGVGSAVGSALGGDVGLIGSSAAAPAVAAPAAAGAGSSGLLGAAGPYAAAAAPLALAAYGASQPGVDLGSPWYNNFGNTVGAGLGPNATIQQKLAAADQLNELGLMQANGTGGSSGLSTDTNFDFGRLMQVLAPYGVTSIAQANQLANSLYNSIPAGQMPTENSHPMVHQA